MTNIGWNRRKAMVGLSALGVAVTAPAVRAQVSWTPSRAVRVIVPFPPGGAADNLARIIEPGLRQRLGQPVLVENRVGATGSIASDYVYSSSPDGSVLLVGVADAHSMFAHLSRSRWDATKFVPIAGLAKTAFILMGRQSLPASNLQELLALMTRESLTYASSGNGSGPHLLGVAFANEARNEKLVHVPYPGASPALAAVVAGQVDLMFVPVGIAGQFRSQMKSYGVTSDSRVEVMKEIPTLTEQALPIVGESWVGVLAPPGTPVSIVKAFAAAIGEVTGEQQFQKRIADLGMVAIKDAQPEFARYYMSEYRKWGEVIRRANIKVE